MIQSVKENHIVGYFLSIIFKYEQYSNGLVAQNIITNQNQIDNGQLIKNTLKIICNSPKDEVITFDASLQVLYRIQ